MIGLIGRAVAGNRAGLLAAAIAAMYPNLWINDGLVMSETLATLSVALAILLAYRFIRVAAPGNGGVGRRRVRAGDARPGRARAAAPADGAAGRAVPEGSSRSSASSLLFLLACVVALAVVSPWLVANLTRFDEPVLFSTNDGLTHLRRQPPPHLVRRGHRRVGARLRELPGAEGRPVGGVERAARATACDFIRDHLGRLPVVVGVREARVWSLYAPGFMANYNVNEGRDVEVSWAGFFAFWVLVPCAVVGGVQLRRRRVPITPLVAQFVIVAVTAAAIYGLVALPHRRPR